MGPRIIVTRTIQDETQTLQEKNTVIIDNTSRWTIFESFLPSILILNRAAHYVPDEQLERELRARVTFGPVQKWWRTCRPQGMAFHLHWRTIRFQDMFTVRISRNHSTIYHIDMEGWVANHPVRERMKRGFVDYHWEDFQRENDFGVEIIGLYLLQIKNKFPTGFWMLTI